MLFAAAFLYSLPKIVMYFVTFRGDRATLYDRLRKYFRTRVLCLVLLFLILTVTNILIMVLSDKLASPDAYDVPKHWITTSALVVSFTWVGTDLYWSIVIRQYKDSKKGKKGEQAAKRLSKIIDPENFILANVKETKYKTTIDT